MTAGRLTQKQENFCLAYIETGNASEAYRRVYNAKGMKPETVNRNAKALLDNNKIATRLEELRKPVAESAQITLAQHLSTLEALRELAKEKASTGQRYRLKSQGGRRPVCMSNGRISMAR